ncbi:MAG TPA: Shedu anti-phage system protein SduA domain-containing protein [Mycobacterium sp.]|nr:Shedu anti-phage system protein SduA domain-containing protein [Mycobacterium sp.]
MSKLTPVLPDWDRPLHYRRGGQVRLRGIDVYYDFQWRDFFHDERAQFKHGQCLAELAQKDCPPGKAPALLLTVRDDVPEQPLSTDTHFYLVVNFPRYLAKATNDVAASYYAHQISTGITSITKLKELMTSPELIREVLDEHLSIGSIGEWVKNRPDRLEQLRALAQQSPSEPGADRSVVVAALKALDGLDAELVEVLGPLLRRSNRAARLAFLYALTSDADGRSATGETLGNRIVDRMRDVREASGGLTALLGSETTNETDLQSFIESHPWLLGLEYVKVRPRKPIPRGSVDFLLERFDGYHDLLELKGPHDAIIEAVEPQDGVPPPASSYNLSRALSQALAQIHVYWDVLTEDAVALAKRYGLQRTSHPRLIVLIGQARQLSDDRALVLRNLNLSLHRVEIIPYDVLADRALAVMANVERYFSVITASA